MRVLVVFVLFKKKIVFSKIYIPRTVEKRSRNGEHCNKGDSRPTEGEDRAVMVEEESVDTQGESLADGVGGDRGS
jgi:hypothetical protein